MNRQLIQSNIDNNILEFNINIPYYDYEDFVDDLIDYYSKEFNIHITRNEEILEIPSNWGTGYKINDLSTTVITFRKK